MTNSIQFINGAWEAGEGQKFDSVDLINDRAEIRSPKFP